MSLIQFKRTTKSLNDIITEVLESSEPLLLDYTGKGLYTTETPVYLAVGNVKGTDTTNVNDAPVFKAFKNIAKANSIVFREGDKITTETGEELGTTKLNVGVITDKEKILDPDNPLWIVVVDKNNKPWKINLTDFLSIDSKTGCINTIG